MSAKVRAVRENLPVKQQIVLSTVLSGMIRDRIASLGSRIHGNLQTFSSNFATKHSHAYLGHIFPDTGDLSISFLDGLWT